MKFFIRLGVCGALGLAAQLAQAQGGAPHIVEAFSVPSFSFGDFGDLLWIASEGSMTPIEVDDSAPGTGILY